MTAARERICIASSFALISSIGGIAVYSHWSSHNVSTATNRAALFVIIMAVVHAAGFVLYKRQDGGDLLENAAGRTAFRFSPLYGSAIKEAVIGQAILGILAALILDDGRTLSFFGVAFLSHWIGIITIMARRPMAPTKFDLSFIRIGILPICILTGGIAPVVWEIIGESNRSGLQRLLGN